MVQPTLKRQRLYKYWPKVSKNHRQMLLPSHPLRKICNRNTLKPSYSCMPNIGTIISSHNKRLLAEPNTPIEDKCNCRKKETCPLLGKCQTKGVLYQATVKREDNQEEQTSVGNHWRCVKLDTTTAQTRARIQSTTLPSHGKLLRNVGDTQAIPRNVIYACMKST